MGEYQNGTAGPSTTLLSKTSRSQLQVFCKVSKFLVDRLRGMDMLKLLTRRGLFCPVVLSCGCTGKSSSDPLTKWKDRGQPGQNRQDVSVWQMLP